jgi:hypothetical protein
MLNFTIYGISFLRMTHLNKLMNYELAELLRVTTPDKESLASAISERDSLMERLTPTFVQRQLC